MFLKEKFETYTKRKEIDVENISKIVVCKQNGRQIGYVLDVMLDEKLNKTGYYVVDEQTEAEYCLPLQDVVLCGECLFVESEMALQSFSFERKSVFEKQVCDEKGTIYGRIERIDFCGDRCIKISTCKGEICAKNILEVGDDFVFLKSKRARRKNIKKLKLEKVFVEKEAKILQPEKVSLSANFYVGKYACQDVFGYNNERVVSKGEKITKTIFENVKKHNKLNELFFVLKN